MNKRSLCALLDSFESPNWSERAIDGTSKVVKWLPVIELEGHYYGISSEGEWAGEFSDKQRIRPSSFYVAFLPILEKSRKDIVTLLNTAIKAVGLPENVIRTFPFDKIVEEALSSSEHWSSLADAWLEDGYPISAELALSFSEHKLVLRWQKQRMDRIIYA